MHYFCRYFSGKSDSKSWSRYWENDPDDPSLKSQKGHLFVLINISSDEEKELNSIGHDINFEFNQNYFNAESNLGIIDNLQQSIDSIVKNPLYIEYKIDFAIVVILNDVSYLASYGDTKIVLKRQNQISLLMNNADTKVELLSGPVKHQDRFLLLTNSFFEKITWTNIKLFLADLKIQSLEENFLTFIYALKDQKNMAAAFIQVESDDQEIKPDSLSPEPLTKVSSKFSKIHSFINKYKNKKTLFVSHHQPKEVDKKRKLTVLICALLLIILFSSIYFGIKKTKALNTEKEYQLLKEEVSLQLENINKTKSISLIEAQKEGIKTQELINKMLKLKIHSEQSEEYLNRINALLSQTGSSQDYVPELYLDINNSFSNSNFEKITINDNKIYLLDRANSKIIYYDLTTNNGKLLFESKTDDDLLSFAFDKKNLYLLSKKEIYLYTNSNLDSKINLGDIVATDFKFWNGAAYVLDSQTQSIWKFSPNSTSFSKAQSWLKNDSRLEFGAVSFSINGKIWVLHQNGNIVSYFAGEKENFSPSQKVDFTRADSIDVTQETELLSFVDNDSFVYIYKKTGELLHKYNFGDIKIKDLVFSENSQFLYLLSSDQKIYFIKL